MGYSETVFVYDSGYTDFELKYYTPKAQVPLCGHATIAAFSLMNSLKILKKPNFKIKTDAGILNISIDNSGIIFMQQNTPAFYEIIDKNVFNKCFNTDYINNKLPVQIVSTGLRDILLCIDSLEHLESLELNFEEISKISQKYNVIGIHAFTLKKDKQITARCRNFAPLYGINEESATGTSNCALSCYLFKYGIKKDKYIYEQGYNLNSPSEIIVKLNSNYNEILSVEAGGSGYIADECIINSVN